MVVIACAIYMFLEGKLGSFEMIILPVLVPVVSGAIGLMTLPYVQIITKSIGRLINGFTELNPLLMSILICDIFFIDGYTYFPRSDSYCYKFNWFR